MRNSEKIIEILEKTKAFVTDGSDTVWTRYKTGTEFCDEIDTWIEKIRAGDSAVFSEIDIAFAPAYSFQEHSMQNGWVEEYLKLAEEFDHEMEKIKCAKKP